MVADDPIAPRVSRPVAPASDLTGANGINTPFMDLPPGNARHEDGDEFSAMAQYHGRNPAAARYGVSADAAQFSGCG
ncbi:hypothetical protein ECZU34_38180 [Escherichia coli]|nr:hypothetical protein ECZU34_38180 [Escherichia coli]GHL79197.1 hypothetical protein ECZU36_04810 [Escherichia coli]